MSEGQDLGGGHVKAEGMNVCMCVGTGDEKRRSPKKMTFFAEASSEKFFAFLVSLVKTAGAPPRHLSNMSAQQGVAWCP